MDTLTQGTELQKQGKQEEALPFLNQVVQEQPNSYLAWTRLGEAQIETDRFAEALQSAERALALNL